MNQKEWETYEFLQLEKSLEDIWKQQKVVKFTLYKKRSVKY